jgi:MFS family permease
MNGRPLVANLARFDGWRAFRHRNYRLFFAGQGVSLIGTWMQTVAQAWLVLQLTGDALLLGVVAAAQFLPVLVLGLFGGLIADHLPKRRTLIGTAAAAMLLAFVLFALTVSGTVQVWHVIVLALSLGCVNAVDMPTRQAFSVEMVGRSDVSNAVALNSAMFNGARVLGPAVAGLTIGAFGVGPAFLVNGISYVAVIIGLLLMRDADLHSPSRSPRPTTVRGVVENLGEGLRYVRDTQLVLLVVVLVGVISLVGMNFSVLIPPLAREALDADATGYGFLMAANGAGSVVAALAIAFSGKTGPRVIGLGALLLGGAELLLGVSRIYPVSIVAMFLVGLGVIAVAANGNTAIQLAVPDRLRGRVLSVYTTVFVGSTPIGGLLMGAIASTYGASVAVTLGGALSIATGLAGLAWLRHIHVRRRPATRKGVVEGAEGAAATLTRIGPR